MKPSSLVVVARGIGREVRATQCVLDKEPEGRSRACGPPHSIATEQDRTCQAKKATQRMMSRVKIGSIADET